MAVFGRQIYWPLFIGVWLLIEAGGKNAERRHLGGRPAESNITVSDFNTTIS